MSTTDAAPSPPDRRHQHLVAICVSTVLVMAGQGVVSPVLPLFADSFGVSTAVVGATITAFGLARLVTNVPAGILADRRGRRILLVGGPLVTAVGMLGSGLAGSIEMLLVSRFVAGLGSGLYMTGAQIYLLDIAGPDERGRFIATNQGALLVGVGFGPAIGGLLADAYGLATPFVVVAGAALVTAAYGYVLLPETGRRSDAADVEVGSRWSLLRSPDFLAVGLVSIGIFSIRAGVRQTLVPLQLNTALGVEIAELGLLFTGLGMIGLVLIWPAGWVTDRVDPRIVIVPTALLVAVGVGITAVADTLTVFVIGLVVSAIGSSITGPAPAAYVASLVDEHQRGAAMGLYRTFGDLGVVASPVVSGAVADRASIPIALGANAVFVGLAGLVFLVVARSSDALGGPAGSRSSAPQ